MGALYVHVSNTIVGVSNNVEHGFFKATPEEWAEFFAGGSKYKIPPGERVGNRTAFEADFAAHNAVSYGLKLEIGQYTGKYYPRSDESSPGYEEMLHTSTVTGEEIAYLKPVW